MPTANDLPPELAEQLVGRTEHNTHDLTMAYMNERGPATIDELLVYLYRVTGKVTSRDYMYQVLKRLRDRNLIARIELESEVVVRHMLTIEGDRHVRDKDIIFVPTQPSRPDFGDEE